MPAAPPSRIQIEDPWPSLDCGRWPVKRTRGDRVEVWADVLRDGHEQLRAAIRVKAPGSRRWREVPMRETGNDRWTGAFEVDELGRWTYSVVAWVDRFASWRDELRRKVAGGQTDFKSELAEGSELLGRSLATVEEALATDDRDRSEETTLKPELAVDVDPELARFGSWYELFPRSWGGFKGVERELPKLAELGFDVLYLPPIHPIGRLHRKGRNNSTTAKAKDPGSPWAIGAEEGGHTAIHPDLGTDEDFDRLVARAREHGISVALDFAIQCSRDHPWLTEHPEWFRWRPDGTIKYAENPPKRYQDIVNVDWDTPHRQELWDALRDVLLHWVERGVRVFRVDNPHTKPLPFWAWALREIRAQYPDTIFLAEAFTRPKLMAALAKAGFNQSYTYFTWKNTRHELTEYMTQLTRSTLPEFFRPNFFANTPDILHEYLQRGGPPAFEARLVLAATLSPTYGLYSGFEHFENAPVAEGSEEYLNSEKYEVKKRKLDGPLLPLIGRLNAIRREHEPFRHLRELDFLETEQEQLIAYAKRHGRATVLVCVNLDPTRPHEGVVQIPVHLGLPPAFEVRDLLAGETFRWRIGRNYVRLEPGKSHVLQVLA